MSLTTFITAVDVTPAAGSYQNIDISAHVPADATGAILHIINTASLTEYKVGYRMKGSTDDRYDYMYRNSHGCAIIGVDANKICQVKIENTAVKVYLTGYTGTDAVFFTNAIDVTPVGIQWQDVNISANTGGNTALAAILDTLGAGEWMGFRKNGSTFSLFCTTWNHYALGTVVGCDANEIFEFYNGGSIYLNGYFISNVLFFDDAIEHIATTDDTYENIFDANLLSSDTGAFITFTDQAYGPNKYAVRPIDYTIGEELVPNGIFDSNINGWDSSTSDSPNHAEWSSSYGGSMRLHRSGSSGYVRATLSSPITVVIGELYRLKINIKEAGLEVGLRAGSTPTGSDYVSISQVPNGLYEWYFTATTTSLYIRVTAGQSSAYVDDISVVSIDSVPLEQYYNGYRQANAVVQCGIDGHIEGKAHVDGNYPGTAWFILQGVIGRTYNAIELHLNIGDEWNVISGTKVQIGGVWNVVSSIKTQIGDSWKVVC